MTAVECTMSDFLANSEEKSSNINSTKRSPICNLSFADTTDENQPVGEANLINFDSLKMESTDGGGSDEGDVDVVYKLRYLGALPVDRRYIAQVYQWIVREMSLTIAEPRPVKVTMSDGFVTLEYEEPCLLSEANSKDSKTTTLSHPYKAVVRLSRLKAFENCFAYVVASGEGASEVCTCHAFQADAETVKNEFLKRLKENALSEPQPLPASSPRRGSLMRPTSNKKIHRRVMSSSNIHLTDTSIYKYSVCYVGKVTVVQPQMPPKFIDDVVKSLLKVHAKLKPKRSNTLSPSKSLRGKLSDVKPENPCQDNMSSSESLNNGAPQLNVQATQGRKRSASDGEQGLPQLQTFQKAEKNEEQIDVQVSNGDEGKSRSVLFQISQSSLILFGSNSRTLLLEKKIQDISYCTKGDTKADHFGFICRENDIHVCYVFYGETECMVDAIMRSIKQAFSDALDANAHLTLCDSCPLQILHKLCIQLDGAAVSEQQSAVHQCSRELSEAEHLHLMNKLHEYCPDNDMEKTKVIVALLRKVIEERQRFHKHVFSSQVFTALQLQASVDDSREIRDRSKSTIFERAKKSVSSSFENLKSRRGRTKTFMGSTPLANEDDTAGGNHCLSPNLRRNSSVENVTEHRPRSRTFHSCPTTPKKDNGRFFGDEGTNSVGNSEEQLNSNGELPKAEEKPAEVSAENDNKSTPRKREGSWRQVMYHSVVSPSRRSSVSGNSEVLLSGDAISTQEEEPPSAPEMAQIRWQKAIKEQILLIRMEKENNKLNNNIILAESRRQKLSYKECNTCTCESIKTWDDLLTKPATDKFDDNLLRNAVRGGVPKFRRGEVWQLLVSQHHIRTPDFDDKSWRDDDYKSLMIRPTMHQHAILIDLGRTFPSHEYFTCQLGPGQISLFNMLKAYSSLDEEVGYCQGLSFVAGLLLMHMPESDAFESFRHVMYALGIRNQYKPNMNAVRQQLYQWTRLLHDCHPAIYEHFNSNDVTPTLYAAPWFLTLFASQFPLGFSARVLDLVFLQGLDVIFKVAFLMVGNHAKEILEQDGFENIVEFMKTELPKRIHEHADDVIRRAVDLEIKQQLNLYEAEYQLMQEMTDSRQSRELLEKQEAMTHELQEQVGDLNAQLRVANCTVANLRQRLEVSERERKTQETATRIVEHERDMLQLTVNALREDTSPTEERECTREIMTNNRAPHTNFTMERSWELVPSPTTVQSEMRNPVEREESCDSSTSGCSTTNPNGGPDSPHVTLSSDSGGERTPSKLTMRETTVPAIAVNNMATTSDFPLFAGEETY